MQLEQHDINQEEHACKAIILGVYDDQLHEFKTDMTQQLIRVNMDISHHMQQQHHAITSKIDHTNIAIERVEHKIDSFIENQAIHNSQTKYHTPENMLLSFLAYLILTFITIGSIIASFS